MKQERQNPHEGIRINLPFHDAVRRALDTPAPSKEELDEFVRTGKRKPPAKSTPKARRK